MINLMGVLVRKKKSKKLRGGWVRKKRTFKPGKSSILLHRVCPSHASLIQPSQARAINSGEAPPKERPLAVDCEIHFASTSNIAEKAPFLPL
jgi:hypothetical protein